MFLLTRFSFAVNSLGGPTLPMDCDTGQEILQGILGSNPSSKQISRNVFASYGLATVKDEDELGKRPFLSMDFNFILLFNVKRLWKISKIDILLRNSEYGYPHDTLA